MNVKEVDNNGGKGVKHLTPMRMLRSKIGLMTCLKALLVMIMLLASGILLRKNLEHQDFGNGVTITATRSQYVDYSYHHNSYIWAGFNTNDENQDFGPDIDELGYFRVAPFDPVHGDDNIRGITHGGSTASQLEISFNNGTGAAEGSTSGIVNHTVGIPSTTVQALEERLAKYEEEREQREKEFQTQLEAERKRRADVEARQQETVAQLAQQIALLEQISTFMRRYMSESPPPPPPPPPPQ